MVNQLDKSNELHQLVRHTVALVLAGGRGSRLKQLTDSRAKPAVYFGGKFRIIDFALSNCLNSGIRRMAVVTQYKSHSLMRHMQRGCRLAKAPMFQNRYEHPQFAHLEASGQALDQFVGRHATVLGWDFLTG